MHLNTSLPRQSLADFVSLLERESGVRVHVSVGQQSSSEKGGSLFEGGNESVIRLPAQLLQPEYTDAAPKSPNSVVLTLRGHLGSVYDAQKIVRVANKKGYTVRLHSALHLRYVVHCIWSFLLRFVNTKSSYC